MPDFLKSLSHSDYVTLSSALAGLAGGASYWLKTIEGKPFRWSEFFIHIVASMLFGLLAFELASFEGMSDEVCGAIEGASGWLGTRLAELLRF